MQAAEAELLRISNRVRFIKSVIAGTLKVNNRKKADVEADLEAQKFDRLPNKNKVGAAGVSSIQAHGSFLSAALPGLLLYGIWTGEQGGVLIILSAYQYIISHKPHNRACAG